METLSVGEKIIWALSFEAEYRRYLNLRDVRRAKIDPMIIEMSDVADAVDTAYRKAIDAAALRVMELRRRSKMQDEMNLGENAPAMMLHSMLSNEP